MSDRAASECVVCELPVRGGDTGFPVTLIRDENGRLAIRGVNEGGFSSVDLDLFDLLEWLGELAPGAINCDSIARTATLLAAGAHT